MGAKHIFRQLFIVFLITNAFLAKGQYKYLNDISGRPFLESNYADVEGSPYLTDAWVKGTVKFSNGKTHTDIYIKYDQVADELLFRDAENHTMRFVDRISEFKIIYLANDKAYEKLFRNGLINIDENNVNAFYEVLIDGRISLLKRTRKKVNEIKAFDSTVAVKRIAEVHDYYLSRKGELFRLKKDRKSLLALLNDQAEQIEKFINQNKLNIKEETQLISIISYYNSL